MKSFSHFNVINMKFVIEVFYILLLKFSKSSVYFKFIAHLHLD